MRGQTSAPPRADCAESPHAPLLLSQREDARQLSELRERAQVFDTIRAQLAELLDVRQPARRLRGLPLALELDRLLEAGSDAYGLWAYYPWSNRLVHVLPEPAFRELRASRNRNKITREEQQRLSRVTLGIAGLASGQATALTLALEGLGGVLRLADFAPLGLSNLNRVRAGVHEIGVNKALVAARAIWELDPYARLELFEDGITDANLGRFLDGLDVLFEQCDEPHLKRVLREEARRRHIPVLMQTCDRGLFDVERFDAEPERPLLHGLLGREDGDAAEVLGDTMSPRMASSLIDLDASVAAWPQLGSAVALGGALNTDAARRILLGQLRSSGRYFVDLEDIVADGRDVALAHDRMAARPTTAPPSARPRRRERRQLPSIVERDQLEQVVHAAALAPSAGNAQPWRFVYRAADSTLECWLVPERARTFIDFQRRASHLAFGAMAENIRLAAARLGFDAQLEAFPDPARAELVCVARLDPDQPSFAGARERMLAEWIDMRVTNRRDGERAPLPAALLEELGGTFDGAACRLTWIEDAARLDALTELLTDGERLCLLHPRIYEDRMAELRWTFADAERTRDGIDVATLELRDGERARLSLLRRGDVIDALRRIDGGHGLVTRMRRALRGACAFGVLRASGSSPAHHFEAGSRMQRLWLLANARGLSLQPLPSLLLVCARLEQRGAGLSAREQAAFDEAHAALRALIAAQPGEHTLFAFRLTQAEPPSARSQRRTVDELLALA